MGNCHFHHDNPPFCCNSVRYRLEIDHRLSVRYYQGSSAKPPGPDVVRVSRPVVDPLSLPASGRAYRRATGFGHAGTADVAAPYVPSILIPH